MYYHQNEGMNQLKIKRTTANLPADLLKEAMHVSGVGITETLVMGLKMLKRSIAYEKAQKLKGKLDLKIDTGVSRERTNR